MKVIGLDAGHGLKTAGKRTPTGIHEWELNDKVRDKVVSLLKGYDVKFVFTDEDEGNVDETLASRVKKYINASVDVFVSLHHNALSGIFGNWGGVEVYVDKNPTSQDMVLANAIYKRLPGYTGLKGRGIKKENWYVINQNKIPAVLVEGGFMDSNSDYKIITSEKGQEAYARAVAEGLVEFLGLTKIAEVTTTTTANTANSNYLSNTSYTGGSIVTALNQIGVDSSFNYRAKLASANGIKNYSGTATQNIQMLNLLKQGKLLKVGTTSIPTSNNYYPVPNYNGGSIVEALNKIGVNSSYSNRSKIASKNGISGYTGTASQNIQMLNLLRQGKLVKI